MMLRYVETRVTWLLSLACALTFLPTAPALAGAIILQPMVMKIDPVNPLQINVYDPAGPGGLTVPVETIGVLLRASAAGTFGSPGTAFPAHLQLVNTASPDASLNIDLRVFYDGAANDFPDDSFLDIGFDFRSAAGAHGIFNSINTIPFLGTLTFIDLDYSPIPLTQYFLHGILGTTPFGFSIDSVDTELAGPAGASFVDLVYNIDRGGITLPLAAGGGHNNAFDFDIPFDTNNPILELVIDIKGSSTPIPEPSTGLLAALGVATLGLYARRASRASRGR